jgi:hypothetical protein
MSADNQYTCREYREEMILLGLRRRLAADGLSASEEQALKEQIRRMEDTLQMD